MSSWRIREEWRVWRRYWRRELGLSWQTTDLALRPTLLGAANGFARVNVVDEEARTDPSLPLVMTNQP